MSDKRESIALGVPTGRSYTYGRGEKTAGENVLGELREKVQRRRERKTNKRVRVKS